MFRIKGKNILDTPNYLSHTDMQSKGDMEYAFKPLFAKFLI